MLFNEIKKKKKIIPTTYQNPKHPSAKYIEIGNYF